MSNATKRNASKAVIRSLEIQQLKLVITRGDEVIEELKTAIKQIRAKQRRRRAELIRQQSAL